MYYDFKDASSALQYVARYFIDCLFFTILYWVYRMDNRMGILYVILSIVFQNFLLKLIKHI